MRQAGHHLQLLERDLVHLVDRVDRRDVNTGALDDVDEVVDVAVCYVLSFEFFFGEFETKKVSFVFFFFPLFSTSKTQNEGRVGGGGGEPHRP